MLNDKTMSFKWLKREECKAYKEKVPLLYNK